MLEQVQQRGGMLSVSVLVEGWIGHEALWDVLEALKRNGGTSLEYLEVDTFFDAGHGSFLSEKGKQLQKDYKTPENTKVVSH